MSCRRSAETSSTDVGFMITIEAPARRAYVAAVGELERATIRNSGTWCRPAMVATTNL